MEWDSVLLDPIISALYCILGVVPKNLAMLGTRRQSVAAAQISIIDRLNLGCFTLDRRLHPLLDAAGERQDRSKSRAALADAAIAAEGLDQIVGAFRR